MRRTLLRRALDMLGIRQAMQVAAEDAHTSKWVLSPVVPQSLAGLLRHVCGDRLRVKHMQNRCQRFATRPNLSWTCLPIGCFTHAAFAQAGTSVSVGGCQHW